MAAKRLENARPAGQHNHLMLLRGLPQDIEQTFDAHVVGIDQRVVEDDGRGLTTLGQQAAKTKPGENRELFLRAAAQRGRGFQGAGSG
jgi:hypothetical protein